jgi:signal transduction histidine kinase
MKGAGAGWRHHARHWRHSLQRRLVALFVVLALASTAVFLFGMQRVLSGGWQAWARPLVSDYVDRLAAEIGSPPDAGRARALALRLPIRVRIDGPVVRYDSHGGGRPGEDGHFDDDSAGDADPGSAAQGRSHGAQRGPGFSLERLTADGHRLRFGLTLQPGVERPRHVAWLTLAALLLLTVLAYIAVRRLLAPVQDIARGVEAYGQGRFDTAIAVRRPDELGELAQRINTMASRLRSMLDAKRALLLAISHELRSPLTRARVNAELVDEGAPRQALLRDLAEMAELVSSLLESERLGDGHAALRPEAVDLAAWLREAVQGRQPAPELQLAAVGLQRVDTTRMRLLLRNLLDNAERHASAAPRPPLLRLAIAPDGRLGLSVRDFGPGVPEDELPRLAEAFYRPDDARTRAGGGVGLGLHLCRLVAQAHGGELHLRRAEPGLQVEMVWAPLPAVAAG